MRVPDTECQTCPSRDESVFQNLTETEISLLNRCKTTNRYKKGQVIFYEDNKPFGIHCIRGGRLKLSRMGPEGREQIVRIVEPGEIIGYKALITDSDYSLSAEALEDTEVCFVDRKAFFDLMDQSTILCRRLLEEACQEMRKSEDAICRVTQKNVRERMADTLLILKERFGKKTEKGWYIDLPLKREEIAGLAGTVLESAVRYLTEFKNDGYIETEGKSIYIRDLEGLVKTAGG